MADQELFTGFLRTDEIGPAQDMVAIFAGGVRQGILQSLARHLYATGRGPRADAFLAEVPRLPVELRTSILAIAAVEAGDCDHAESLIRETIDSNDPYYYRDMAWESLITKLVATGQAGRAKSFASALPPAARSSAEYALVEALVESGDFSHPLPPTRDRALVRGWNLADYNAWLAWIAAKQGDFDRAESLLALTGLAVPIARSGDWRRAMAIVMCMANGTDPGCRGTPARQGLPCSCSHCVPARAVAAVEKHRPDSARRCCGAR